jgi:hypothetical protein
MDAGVRRGAVIPRLYFGPCAHPVRGRRVAPAAIAHAGRAPAARRGVVAGTRGASRSGMPAVLALIGLPIAFAVAVLFIMTMNHSIGPVIGVGLILSLLIFFVGMVRWAKRLESSSP